MKLRGSIICCFLLQFSNLVQKQYTFYNIIVVCIHARLDILSTPTPGVIWLMSTWPGIVQYTEVWFSDTCYYYHYLFIAIICFHIVISKGGRSAIAWLIGIGLFEANAIQFGLDQILEAPTPKLISFIHWYYNWSQHIGELVVFYIGYISYFTTLEECLMSKSRNNNCIDSRVSGNTSCYNSCTGSLLFIFHNFFIRQFCDVAD